MKTKNTFAVALLSLLTLALAGCANHKSSTPQVTIPNGRSPASENAPHGSMNDTPAMRSGWNHGNGALWVHLPPGGVLVPSQIEKDGSLRVKFGWWRGVPGELSV